MTLEVRKVTHEDFDKYWTPDVRKILDNYIYETKNWAVNFEKKSRFEKKWVMDVKNEITLITVAISVGIDHPSEMSYEDIAVVSKEGSIGLLKHFCDDELNDMYKIILLTGIFENSVEEFKKLILNAIELGGLWLDGSDSVSNRFFDLEKIKFFDIREDV